MNEPIYSFLEIEVDAARSDDLVALLFELGSAGIEERDEETLTRGARDGWRTLVASFDSAGAADAARRALEPSFSPRIVTLEGDGWRDAWKEHFAPFALTPRLVVRPPWSAPTAAPGGCHVLTLEPGRAFGTGLHATTALCARALDAHAEEFVGREVLDVGTGSGILALAALLLGASRAVAIDEDADAVEVARENAERNGLLTRIVLGTTPLAELPGRFAVVVANLETRVLVPSAEALLARAAPGGVVVLSGVLVSERDAVIAAFEGGARATRARVQRLATPEQEGWVAIVLRIGEGT